MNWMDQYKERIVSASEAVKAIKSGDRVVFGAQSGVPSSVKSDQRLIGAPPMEEKPFFKSSAIFRKLPDMYFELNALRKELNELKKQLNKE